MMKIETKCKQAQLMIHESVDGELSSKDTECLFSHISECTKCRDLLHSAKELKSALLNLQPCAPLSRSLYAKVINHTAIAPTISPPPVIRAYPFHFGQAVLATVAIVLLIGSFLLFPMLDDNASQQGVKLQGERIFVLKSLNKTQQVYVVFISEFNLENVKFSVRVPPHIELTGYSGLQELEWDNSIKKGKNLLSIPIIAHKWESGKIVMQLKYGNEQKTFVVHLDARFKNKYTILTRSVEIVGLDKDNHALIEANHEI